ncbi:hypothetical protein BE04_25935 [Sorangium cellulosum]|uniref:Secreted protein n=1 Tax=Sorangium cellulosum TaxID=56 RepID=A0A150PWC9_SORCE|nr:hypothetical protein BE04_25935 [Sorangium cellulosum]
MKTVQIQSIFPLRLGGSLLLAASLLACSSDGEHDPGSTSSAGTAGGGNEGAGGDGAGGGDAQGARCDPRKPFGSREVLEEIEGDVVSSWLTADELTILFSRETEDNDNELFLATRPSRDAAFGAPRPLTGVNTRAAEYGASMSPDGLSLYYISTAQACVSRRASTAEEFGPGELMTSDDVFLNGLQVVSGGIYYVTAYQAGDNELYFLADPTDPLSEPYPAVEYDGRGERPGGGFHISSDGLTLLYSTAISGDGSSTFYRATRPSTEVPKFRDVEPIAELNDPSLTPKVRTVSWVSDDGCVLYGPTGLSPENQYDIVRATRGR